MPLFIQYLLKLSISLALVYLFYQLLFRRLTFYNFNRWYLLGYSLVSFFIPFINIESFTQQNNFDNVQLIRYIPVIKNYTTSSINNIQQSNLQVHTINGWQIFYLVLIAGSLIMLLRLVMQFFSLQKIKRKSTVINDGETFIYHVDEKIIPFSFGNSIYINQHLHSEKELQEIILHEYVHVKQNHTTDIFFAELLCIINWYNPFAWLIRHAIRQNLEFIADNYVLQNGLDKKSYQYHLLKVVGLPQYRIGNSFNFSSLKKRIAMMNKIKTAKVHLLRFLFLMPLLAVLLLAFRGNTFPISKMKSHGMIDVIPLVSTTAEKEIPKSTMISNASISINTEDKNNILVNNKDTIPENKNDMGMPISHLNEVHTVFLNGKKLDNPLFIIDGKQSDSSELKKLDPNKIYSIEVLKDSAAISQYGEKAKDGVIIIRTKKDVSDSGLNKKDTVPSSAAQNHISFALHRDDNMNNENKEFFKRNTNIQLLHWTAMNELEIYHVNGKIETIKLDNNNDVQKAVSKYGKLPQFAESYKDQGGVLIPYLNKGNSIVLQRKFEDPLYVIDGKLCDSPEFALKKLNPDSIFNISVLKDSAAISRFGEKGKKGVIIILTKKYVSDSSDNKKDKISSNNQAILKADTIVYDKTGLKIINGSIAMDENDKTSIINASIFFDNENGKTKIPLIFFNGREVDRYKSFRAINGSYKLISLNRKQASEKYGKKGIDGALEIFTL